MANEAVEAAQGRQNAVLDQQYQLDLEQYNNQVIQEKELRTLKDDQNLKQYKYQTGVKEAQEQAQVDAYERSNEVYENNLQSIDFYADTARGRVQLGLDEQIAELSFQLEDLDRDFARRAAAAAFGDTQQQQIIDNAKENAGLNRKELAIQKGQRKAEFDARLGNIKEERQKIASEFDIRRAGLSKFDIQKKKLRTETRYNQLNNQLEAIVKTGAAKARGLKGRGADKIINSIAAMSGLNSQQFNDSLYFAEESIKLEKKLEKDTIRMERSYAKNTLKIKKELTKKEKLSILGDETAKEGSASYLGALGIKKKQITAGKKQTVKAAKTKKDEIAQMLGIDVEEIEFSKDKLAESLMSAGAAAKIQLEDIENKAFEAKTQSYAQRMLKPRFGPALPAPFKTPKTEYIKPLPPIYHSRGSIKGGSVGGARPQQPSGLSTALSIGGTALTAIAPFTGPAAGVVAGIGVAANLFSGLFNTK